MSKEKQIEEMARTLCGEKEITCRECDSYDACEFWMEASVLYHAGYRKQSVGEWEDFEIPHMIRCSECGVSDLAIHRQSFSYCHNCGAKMKGGE